MMPKWPGSQVVFEAVSGRRYTFALSPAGRAKATLRRKPGNRSYFPFGTLSPHSRPFQALSSSPARIILLGFSRRNAWPGRP
jgi:hypothetical protein